MKKNLKAILLLLVVSIFATGCFDYKVEMSVNDDKSVDFNIEYTMNTNSIMNQSCKIYGEDYDYKIEDKKNMCCPSNSTDVAKCIFLEDLEEDVSEEDEFFEEDTSDDGIYDKETLKKLEEKGYVVTEIKEEQKKGVKISKKFDNIDKISKSNEKVVFNIEDFGTDKYNEYFFTVKKGLLKNTYTANIIFNLTEGESEETMDETDTEMDMTDEDMAYDLNEDLENSMDMSNMLNIKYIINLPNKAVSHNNATLSNNDKTLTWNLKYGKVNEINYVFELDNNKGKTYKIAISAVCTLVIIIILIAILKKCSKK